MKKILAMFCVFAMFSCDNGDDASAQRTKALSKISYISSAIGMMSYDKTCFDTQNTNVCQNRLYDWAKNSYDIVSKNQNGEDYFYNWNYNIDVVKAKIDEVVEMNRAFTLNDLHEVIRN